jgi:putative methionine-R-sulfoxide reductase with GAF domain
MMSLVPIWVIDFVSNLLLMGISVYLVLTAKEIVRLRPHTPLWMYLHWQSVALAIFAFSHSTGHIVQRGLTVAGKREVWDAMSPFTGGIISLTFVVVAILSFLYRDIEAASEKYGSLKEAKQELEQSLIMLRDSSAQMERDAEEILRKNKEISALYKVAMAISKSLEIDRVLSAIIKEMKEFSGVNFLGIYLVEGRRITLKVSDGLSSKFAERAAVRSVDEPWLKREVMEGRPFFVRERLDEHAGKIDPEIKEEGMQAWAAVPLVAKGKVVGVLTVGSSDYDGIDTRQIDTLSTIGGYVGVAIENSMLYEELKQKVEDLERFRKFSVGREMRIIELKEKLKELEERLTRTT